MRAAVLTLVRSLKLEVDQPTLRFSSKGSSRLTDLNPIFVELPASNHTFHTNGRCLPHVPIVSD